MEPLAAGELAEKMDLASATTSLLAERREDEHDRRRTILSLPQHLQAA
jgi:hypothetical protein